MIIIPPGQMAQSEIKLLRDNDICVVIAKNPEKLKFVDPIPAISQRGEIETAAIKFTRLMLNPSMWNNSEASWNKQDMAKMFTTYLINGTPLDSRGTKQEQETSWYDQARRDEIERMARAEAKEEREAKKKALLSKSESTETLKSQ
jgi:hypothetical protein